MTFTLPLVESLKRIIKKLCTDSLLELGYMVQYGDISDNFEPPLNMIAFLFMPAVRDERQYVVYCVKFYLYEILRQEVISGMISSLQMLTVHIDK